MAVTGLVLPMKPRITIFASRRSTINQELSLGNRDLTKAKPAASVFSLAQQANLGSQCWHCLSLDPGSPGQRKDVSGCSLPTPEEKDRTKMCMNQKGNVGTS